MLILVLFFYELYDFQIFLKFKIKNQKGSSIFSYDSQATVKVFK